MSLSTQTQAADEFIAKPYLQIGQVPAKDALQLLWQTSDADADWSVTVQTAAGKAWRKAETPTFRRIAVAGVEPHRVYRSAIGGLESGAMFNYVVSKDGKAVFSAEGHAPKSADQPYRFVVFGDCGAGTPEQKPVGYQAYLSKPDFVMITGDIVYERGLIEDYRKKFWPVYNADEATASGVPLLRSSLFVAAPGNHDIDTRDLDKYPTCPFLLLLLEPAAQRPHRHRGRADRPRADGLRHEPEGLHRSRRRDVSQDGELLFRLRQRPLDRPRREPLHGLD